MTETLYRWRVYCVTDSKYEFTWRGETEEEPSVCPVNTSHTIDASQNRIVQERKPDLVEIIDERTPTGGNPHLVSINFDALPNQVTNHSWQEPFPINIISSYIFISSENRGDLLTVEISPNTVIGTITADVAISDTVIDVSQSVIDNIDVGYWVTLNNTVIQEDLGRVISIDKNNLQITVETASTQIFLAVTPTFIEMTVRYMCDLELSHAGRLDIGRGNIGSSYVPANTSVITKYDNKHATDTKRFVGYVEYFY
jgi:hypothetical protein